MHIQQQGLKHSAHRINVFKLTLFVDQLFQAGFGFDQLFQDGFDQLFHAGFDQLWEGFLFHLFHPSCEIIATIKMEN